MAEIVAMIERANGWRKEHRTAKRYEEAWLAATRMHALLDALKAIGGDTTKWRNEVGILRP